MVLENFEFVDSNQDAAQSQEAKPYEAPKDPPPSQEQTPAEPQSSSTETSADGGDPDLDEDVPF